MHKIIQWIEGIAIEVKGATAGAVCGLVFTPDFSHLINVALEAMIKGVFGAAGGFVFAVSVKYVVLPITKYIWRAIK